MAVEIKNVSPEPAESGIGSVLSSPLLSPEAGSVQ